MDTIKVRDKEFKLYLAQDEIQCRVREVAQQLHTDLVGQNPLFVCVLNGAFVFASDLLRAYGESVEMAFVRFSSYCGGTASTGTLKKMLGLDRPVAQRNVVVVEDIVDSGLTLYNLKQELEGKGAASVRIVTLLQKPEALKYPLQVDYAAFKIPNDFILGYGLDYEEEARNLPDIYVVTE